MTRLAVLNARQLVTLSGPARPRIGPELGHLAIIAEGGFIAEDGRIVEVGPSEQIETQLTEDTVVVDAAGKVVLPGFVDAHTHPVFGGNRVDEFERRALGTTYEEIAASGGGIQSTVATTRQLTEDQLLEQSKRYSQWFLQNGTTTVEAKSGYGLDVESELKILRVIKRLDDDTALRYIATFLGAHAIPGEYANDPSAYVQKVIVEMLPKVKDEDLADFCDVFCEPGYFSIEDSMKILGEAKSLGFQLRVHADQLTRSGGAEVAASAGAITADHLEQLDAEGIAALRSAWVQPVLLPASVHCLGKSKYPPARELIGAGLAVVLATDFNPGSSPTPSMPFVLSLACTQMKMSPAEALTAATVNAAYSLGWGGEIGSLERDKIADFALYDCEDYRELAYWAGTNLASEVWASGMLAYKRASPV